MSVDFDMSEFLDGMDAFEKGFLDAAERGAGQAGSALLNDTITEMPAAPLDEGTLRGSGSVFVQNKLVGVSPKTGGKPTPATAHEEAIPSDTIVAVVGFNTPYAAVQHEGERADGTRIVQNYSHSGTGKKFLEKKLMENGDDYVEVASREVRRFMGNA